jgi:glucosamine 6-phosphate synthetase-like amidotransferase/phosphosugar isomerase protein
MDVGNSPAEAMRSAFLRLQGHFAAMALFAQPQEQLIVGSRGYPLSLGICYESLIVGSDTQILKQLSQSVMVIEEGKPVVLCSV